MIRDKNGNEVTLQEVLQHLVGTDEMDSAKSVLDFSVYPVLENGNLGDPRYYLVATDVVVTQLSMLGTFTMMELDFRKTGVYLLGQVQDIIMKFHESVNSENVAMLSTLTPLDSQGTHIMTFINPLVCVRGYSEAGQASTILQLIYATENIGIGASAIDYSQIERELDEELKELESANVSEEIEEAAAAVAEDTKNAEMQQAFEPDFISEPKRRKRGAGADSVVRISGHGMPPQDNGNDAQKGGR